MFKRRFCPSGGILPDDLPRDVAPAAQTWSAVAKALGQGLSSLEPVKLWLILAGGVVGDDQNCIEHWVPRSVGSDFRTGCVFTRGSPSPCTVQDVVDRTTHLSLYDSR